VNHENVYLLNFGAKLSDEVLENIKKEVNVDKCEQIMIKVNLDLSKNPYLQCHDIVSKARKYILSDTPFVINLPGLPIACTFIINEISAIKGREPILVFTSRNISGEGFFSDFKFRRLFDLSYEKTVTREKFKNGEKETERF
jgi:hypothetical protein